MSHSFYSAPSHMTGGYVIYSGSRRQRGAGLFGSFRNILAPVGRQALSGLKSIARNKMVQDIAKQAAQKSAEVLTGVAVDALQGRNVGESFKERARQATLESLGAVQPHTPSRKRAVKLKQRKRLPSVQSIAQPAFKKQRRNVSRAALNRRNLF